MPRSSPSRKSIPERPTDGYEDAGSISEENRGGETVRGSRRTTATAIPKPSSLPNEHISVRGSLKTIPEEPRTMPVIHHASLESPPLPVESILACGRQSDFLGESRRSGRTTSPEFDRVISSPDVPFEQFSPSLDSLSEDGFSETSAPGLPTLDQEVSRDRDGVDSISSMLQQFLSLKGDAPWNSLRAQQSNYSREYTHHPVRRIGSGSCSPSSFVTASEYGSRYEGSGPKLKHKQLTETSHSNSVKGPLDAKPRVTQDFNKSDEWFRNLGEKLHKPLADSQRNKSTRVKIGILDTGIYLGHEDFRDDQQKGKIVVKDFLRCTTNTSSQEAIDKDGHGTHCAGLLRRVAPAADIFVAKIAHDTDSIDQMAVATAIEHAVDEKEWDVDILSLSFGFDQNSRIEEAVEKAVKGAVARGKLVFAATSNSGTSGFITYPAWESGVIAINSADANGNPSKFLPSDTAEHRPFTVLGEDVKSAWICSDQAPGETSPTRRMTGTSVATPIAAGTAALVLQAASLPCEKIEDQRVQKQLLQDLRCEAHMRDVLKDISAKRGGFRNLRPCDLVRTELKGCTMVTILERIVARKKKSGRAILSGPS